MYSLADIKTWFDSLGWLANIVTFWTPLIALIAILYKSVQWWLRPSTFGHLINRLVAPRWTKEDMKSIGEIAIVDDNPSDFPVNELRKTGYKIKVYKQISLSDVINLTHYDLVFLDIHGIVRDNVERGGLELITKLRALNPRQKICAVSSKTFDPTATTFFRLADDVQKKPLSAQKCEEVIELLLLEKLEPQSIAMAIDNHIKDVSTRARRKLVGDFEKFSRSQSSIQSFKSGALLQGKTDSHVSAQLTDLARIVRHATS